VVYIFDNESVYVGYVRVSLSTVCNLPSPYSTKNQYCLCTDIRIWLHYKATILSVITSMMNF